jgi:hypothetical protein
MIALLKRFKTLIGVRRPFHGGLLIGLAAMAVLVTGCPHNEYIVQLVPHGDTIDRTLVFYCVDGVNTNTGMPNYRSFDKVEMAAITGLYPGQSLTNIGQRHTIRGEFTNAMPADVGGAGTYTHLTTSLGEADLYVERFRGNDDLASLTESHLKSADQLTDLIIGWSQMELGREPGYGQLHQFLNTDFRRDLKNFSTYWWAAQLVNNYNTNAAEEFVVRFGLYLYERGYFTVGELPGLYRDVSGNDEQPLLRRVQRLVAHKMGVPDSDPVPAALAFLGQENTMDNSFDEYLAGTDFYRAKLKQWKQDQKLKPDTKKPDPSVVLDDLTGKLIEFDLFGHPDHLTVHLSLPAAPVHSNGRWDATLKQVVWESNIDAQKTNDFHFPFNCYANWVQADEAYQVNHFGRVVLTGDDLNQYCLWRCSLDPQQGAEWDALVAGLHPGNELLEKIDAFRFSGEPAQAGTNKVSGPSSFPRELLEPAMR